MALIHRHAWRGRHIAWQSFGSGPAVVLCHGTPWSSAVWLELAHALSEDYTCFLWDMPGYGESSKDPGHAVDLATQASALVDLLGLWGLDRTDGPHLVGHDIGGAVVLRAMVLHHQAARSVFLADAVAVGNWGSPFFDLVRNDPATFERLPGALHEALVRRYIVSALHRELSSAQVDALTAPWLGPAGQAAFYRQIAQADVAHTDELAPHWASMPCPVRVVWGREDPWLSLDDGHRLARSLGTSLQEIEDCGHLIQWEQPARLALQVRTWLDRNG